MKNLVLVLVSIFLISCALDVSRSTQEGATYHQTMIYTDYVNSVGNNKVLVRTTIPVREIVDPTFPDLKTYSRGGRDYAFMFMFGIDGMTKKNYYSENKSSYEHAIIEAFEYCKRDNEDNYQEICALEMIGNFNATQYEKKYAEDIFNSNLYQITIPNVGLKSLNASNYYILNCRYINHNDMRSLNTELPTKKKSFAWTECKTNIRFNLDEIIERYSRPKSFSEETI